MKPPDKRNKPPGGDGLLNPDSFWETEKSADRPPAPKPSVVEPDEEIAVVISPPTSQPDELYLPRAEREVKPEPPKRQAPPRPPRPVARDVVSQVPEPRPSRAWVVPLVIGLAVLAGFMAWHLLSDKTPSGPVEDQRAAGLRDDRQNKLPAAFDGIPAKVPDPAKTPAKLSALKTGILKLTSDPAGAVVFINDEKRGATPTAIKDIQAGSVLSLRIEAEGYRPWTQTVSFDGKDLNREFHAGLLEKDACQEGSGWVYVSSAPAGATVELDKKRLPGKTPMVIDSVCAGVQHSIRVQARGFRTWWHSFKVTPGQVMNLKADLKK